MLAGTEHLGAPHLLLPGRLRWKRICHSEPSPLHRRILAHVFVPSSSREPSGDLSTGWEIAVAVFLGEWGALLLY